MAEVVNDKVDTKISLTNKLIQLENKFQERKLNVKKIMEVMRSLEKKYEKLLYLEMSDFGPGKINHDIILTSNQIKDLQFMYTTYLTYGGLHKAEFESNIFSNLVYLLKLNAL